MKKIISLVLCLVLVFSVCSFSLTSYANPGDDFFSVGYCFNNNSIFIRFNVRMSNWRFSSPSMCVITDPDTINYEMRFTPQNVYVPGTFELDEIFEEYLPNCDLLERIDDYFGRNTCNFSKNYTVSEYLSEVLGGIEFEEKSADRMNNVSFIDEEDISNILYEVNPINMKQLCVSSDLVEDMSPIVDTLLSICKDSLESVTFRCNRLSTIDNRLFTEFPCVASYKLKFPGCNILHFNDKLAVKNDDVYFKMSQSEYDEAKNTIKHPKQRMQWIVEEKILPEISIPENVVYDIYCLAYVADIQFCYVYNDKIALLDSYDLYYLVKADPTKDNVVDSFDVAMTTEYVNNFEEPEDEGVKIAMDVVEDGYIDATDLAYVSYIANFEG